MANIKMTDVAAAAGVSIATVGRVLHKNGYVSEETRVRVEKAVAELGYVPNRMARALKQQKSGVIGSLVVFNRNTLYQKINSSIIDAAERHGYKLLTIEGRQDVREEEDLVDQFIGMQVEGLVVTSNRFVPHPLFDRLHRLHIPVVMVERTLEHRYVDNLAVRDVHGAYQTVSHMVRKGHRRIGLIAVEREDNVERERFEGYIKALEEGGMKRDDRLIHLYPQYTIEYGYEAMGRLMELEEPPTAVFCTADTLAAGAMQLLHSKNKHVPGDMSIAGYDNVLASELSPPINSVDLALQDIGETVLRLLKRRMDDPEAEAVTELIDTIYVDRGTVIQLKK